MGEKRQEAQRMGDEPDLAARGRDHQVDRRGTDKPALPNHRVERLLIGSESVGEVASGLGELAGQHIGTDDRQAGAAAHRRTGRVTRVADQSYPAAGPSAHHDMGDRVQVEVVGLIKQRQESRRLPPQVAVQVPQQSTLGVGIVPVNIVWSGCAPQESRSSEGSSVLPGRGHRGPLSHQSTNRVTKPPSHPRNHTLPVVTKDARYALRIRGDG